MDTTMNMLAALLAVAAIAHQAAAAMPAPNDISTAPGAARVAGVDPLTADIDARDALRFARLMQDGAVPTADVLQRGYLDGAGRGVRIFTPGRIRDAQHLARVVAAKPDDYRYAIRECLPQLPALRSDLRAIYLAFAGLLPDRPLPAIDVVFGARNSGGTADAEAQVIGLEVTCVSGTTPAQFRTRMRGFFAHETVHTWQADDTPQALADPLLNQALREGVADYLAALVTGDVPILTATPGRIKGNPGCGRNSSAIARPCVPTGPAWMIQWRVPDSADGSRITVRRRKDGRSKPATGSACVSPRPTWRVPPTSAPPSAT